MNLDSIIASVYRGILRREPDEYGLSEFSKAMSRGELTLTELIERMIDSDEFRGIIDSGLSEKPSSPQHRFVNDVTQFGEFELLLKLWVDDGALHRIVVDVGARGRERSNSYDLMKTFGWKGLLIEANPALISSIEQEFAGLDIELINCAASDFEGTAQFHIGANDDVSSLNSAAASGWGEITGTVNVPVKRLGPMLEERKIPIDFDLLSLDIEGEDIKVLNDLIDNNGFLPKWIIIEASYNFATKSLMDLPFSEKVRTHYSIVGQTPANLILKSKSL